jgi:uncharacterized protein (UPF0254 family)
MDLRLTIDLGEMEPGSNINSPCTSIRKIFKICKLIATLGAEMVLETPSHAVTIFATNGISHGSIANVTEYTQELQILKDVRINQVTCMATEISRF